MKVADIQVTYNQDINITTSCRKLPRSAKNVRRHFVLKKVLMPQKDVSRLLPKNCLAVAKKSTMDTDLFPLSIFFTNITVFRQFFSHVAKNIAGDTLLLRKILVSKAILKKKRNVLVFSHYQNHCKTSRERLKLAPPVRLNILEGRSFLSFTQQNIVVEKICICRKS